MAAKSNEDTVETFVTAGKEYLESAVKAGTAAAQNFAQGFEASKKHVDDALKSCDELAAFSRENMDACVAASNVAAKAARTMNSEAVALSKKAYDANLAGFKALTAAKSPQEFFALQNDLLKNGYEDFVAGANKMQALFTAAATDAFAPLNARFAATAEKLSKSMA